MGQRPVRRVPVLACATLNSLSPGFSLFDEEYPCNGELDRYDWKLIGKQEMLIPYNDNGFQMAKSEQVLGAHHLNPEYVHWELHRVWVVEATLVFRGFPAGCPERFVIDIIGRFKNKADDLSQGKLSEDLM